MSDAITDAMQDKKLDAQAFAEVIDDLPEGDKREIMGYAKCLWSSNRRPLPASKGERKRVKTTHR